VFLLTEEEKELIEKDSRVQQACYYPLPEASFCYRLEQRLQPNRSTSINSSFDNYALLRCCALSGSLNNLNSPVTGMYTYNYTGSGVDVVLLDSGIIADHPEWRSRFTGQSRLQRINWTLFYSLTSEQTQIVTFDNNSLLLNNVSAGPILCWNHTAYKDYIQIIGVPLNYTFNVNGINNFGETDKKFVISSTLSGTPLPQVTNNNAPSGNVILLADYIQGSNPNGIPSTLYYYVTSVSENKIWGDARNVITSTNYNTLNVSFYNDFNGHGTHCTGIAAGSAFGWAKEAHIYMVTGVGMPNGIDDTQLYGLPLVLEWHKWKKTQPSLSARPTVCSNSWAIQLRTPQALQADYYPEYATFNNVVKQMVEEGIHFVRAAGNQNIIIVPFGHYLYDVGPITGGFYSYRIGTPGWPANEPTGPLYLVGASDVTMDTSATSKLLERKVDFSTKGPALTIFAPGTNIVSADRTGTLYRGGIFGNYYMSKKSGTSMSCPQAAGWLATVLEQFPTATPAEMNAFIKSNAIMNTLLESSNTTFSLASADNLFLYQHPAPQFFFKDMVDGLTVLDNPNKSISYSVSGRFTNTSPITSMLYSTFSHTYSALSAAYINLSYSGL
jgi:subtilisin family serine protease